MKKITPNGRMIITASHLASYVVPGKDEAGRPNFYRLIFLTVVR